MKPDELALLTELRVRTEAGERPYVRDIVRELGMNEKRAAYILMKWHRRGWYEWGVNILAGWLKIGEAP